MHRVRRVAFGLSLIVAVACATDSKPAAPETRAPPAARSEPRAAGSASDLIGNRAPAWQLSRWRNSAPLTLSALRGKVVFVRFWTNTCPYCAESMPAIETLQRRFADDEVVFVGAYHSKPRGSEREWEEVTKLANSWGVTFPIAYDRDWTTVDAWWLSTGERSATSASFVIDRRGKFSHVHPGPLFIEGDDDYLAIEAAIRAALADTN